MIVLFLLNISLGSVSIPFTAVVNILTGGDGGNENWAYILMHYRLPKAFTAILAGSSLALSGLLMQTLFRNPLAGPFVLGISSGASLGVALLIMGTSLLPGIGTGIMTGSVAMAIAASLGSFVVLLCIFIMASRVRDTMALLIIGLMFGSLTAAIVSVLSYFSNMEQLQRYIFWSFGNLGDLSWSQVVIFIVIVFSGITISILCIKPLNGLLLGENYARSMGMNVKKVRYLIIIATSLLAGSVTAFAGPVAFIGLAVPHLSRQIFRTPDHRILMPAVLISGAILMLVCDTVAQLPFSAYSLPINAVTSLIGAPVVIWLLVRKRKLLF
ncbi:FecCD family ABC transporter permease [Robertkochia solimangrovi]|uniref:FecCD family ABC transporter permease n=1 Tax=Robertkochia solimangrovi TaxID=2213046 RepID=UPI00117CB2FB|nr:iron ABC transporter permease [Robertkochia solimangrovi]TRZ43655.1 iron ABC transporter permease [Robertkochia solimangrovi]